MPSPDQQAGARFYNRSVYRRRVSKGAAALEAGEDLHRAPGDPALTDAQRFYLRAFDALLLADTDTERVEARKAMAVRLNFVMGEANLELPDGTRWREPSGAER